MSGEESRDIIAGTVVELFEARQVLCGVCTAVKNQRLAVLTEQNREINMAASRVIHVGSQLLDLKLGRDELVRRLLSIASLRKDLMKHVDVEEIWSLVEGEGGAYSALDLAEFVFSEAVSEHHVAATQRVLLDDRLYFQFKDSKFQPRSQEKVEQRRLEIAREAEKEAQLEQGSEWLQSVWIRKARRLPPEFHESIIEDLKSYCLFGQDFSGAPFVKELFKRANIPPQPQSAFRLLVRMGIWTENENLYLHEQNISPDFPEEVIDHARKASESDIQSSWDAAKRRDLRHLHTFTIDSALTRDYDDALSLTTLPNGLFEVGIHIADAAQFVSKGDPVDIEAEARAASIYLPDGRIAMMPPALSESACSLKAQKDRLAMSFLIRMDEKATIFEREIVLSVVNIREQLTYEAVNERIEGDEFLKTLFGLAQKLREERLANGAIILPLPEIQAYVKPNGMIQVTRYEKETPSQIMVSEWMIAANALAASYLAERSVAAIFRSQAECKPETDFTQSEHEIFRIYRQRRLFARAELDIEPHPHCSLAIPCYTTVTSPIRRYSDLVVQRQLKEVIAGHEPLYTADELRRMIAKLGAVQSKISFIQRKWTRYWILKYMEQEDLTTLNCLVLDQNERYAHLLIPDFLIETNAPLPEKTRLQPGEMIRVKIERLNPREDLLKVQLQEFPKSS